MVSVATTPLCHCRAGAALDGSERTDQARLGPQAIVCQPLLQITF